MDGQEQQATITITGQRARETWTAGEQTIADTTTSLTLRDETWWITRRHAELHAIGWRLAAHDPASRVSSAGA